MEAELTTTYSTKNLLMCSKGEIGTNLPTPEGWMAWLATGAGSNHQLCACAASLLPLRRTHPVLIGMQ
ncbi:hypothetical protein Y032_0010g875 [Ancylostoma ceylanicum]|uniref:Uncharacterized protein n=1 Tax=Ancylostoma ceylanicum TaxID=53326 RepID=A0A016VGV0_9BILA|nr:hypothetical protein Y032_0010g875 [Ancylostoma ceylanicum]